MILLVNKWDLVEKETNTAPHFEKTVRERYPFLQWVPIVFVSALTGQRVRKVLDLVLEVADERGRRVETHEVNEVLEALVRQQPPPHHRGRPVKLKYGDPGGHVAPHLRPLRQLPEGRARPLHSLPPERVP